MKPIYIILLSMLFFLLYSCSEKENENDINILINGLPDSKVIMNEILPKKIVRLDSVKIKEGESFFFSLKTEESRILQFEFINNEFITLIYNPGDRIRVSADYPNILETYIIEGSPESELFREYTQHTLRNLHKIDSLALIFEAYKNDENFQVIRESLGKQYMDIFSDQQSFVRNFIVENPGSLAALVAFKRKFGNNELFDSETDIDLLIKLDSGLTANYPNSIHTTTHRNTLIDLQNYLTKKMIAEQYTAVGMPLPAFSISDTENKRIGVESLKDKPLLIYFWASWNGLSRQMNHVLKDLTKGRDDVNVLAISMDQNPDLWKAAIKIDELNFINASDLKGNASPLFVLLNLPNKLPYFIYCEKGGTIEYRGRDIDELKLHISN